MCWNCVNFKLFSLLICLFEYSISKKYENEKNVSTQIHFGMQFFRATYTSIGGDVVDFVFSIDNECKFVKDLVKVAIRELITLYLFILLE